MEMGYFKEKRYIFSEPRVKSGVGATTPEKERRGCVVLTPNERGAESVPETVVLYWGREMGRLLYCSVFDFFTGGPFAVKNIMSESTNVV